MVPSSTQVPMRGTLHDARLDCQRHSSGGLSEDPVVAHALSVPSRHSCRDLSSVPAQEPAGVPARHAKSVRHVFTSFRAKAGTVTYMSHTHAGRVRGAEKARC